MKPEWTRDITDEQWDRFIETVIQIYPKYFSGYLLDKEQGMLFAKDSKQSINLANLAMNCSLAGETDMPQVIEEFFRKVLAANVAQESVSEITFEEAKDKLLLRPSAPNMFGQSGIDPKTLVSAEEFPRVATVAVLDFPETMTTVTLDYAKRWGKDPETILDQARENMTRLPPPQIGAKELSGSTVYLLYGDDYAAARYGLIGAQPALVGKYGSFVAMPDRTSLLIMPVNGKQELNNCVELIELVRTMFNQAVYQISDNVAWYHDGFFREIAVQEKGGDQVALNIPLDLLNKLNE